MIYWNYIIFHLQNDKNLENVTHEQAVAALKSITDKVTLVIGKPRRIVNSSLAQVNSHSTGAVNNIGQNVVDFGRSASPGPATSRSHSPLPRKNFYISFFFLILNITFLIWEPASRYASSNVLAAVPPGTPRAVSTEDITR